MDIAPFGSNVRQLAQSTDKQAAPLGETISELAHSKRDSGSADLDAAIVTTNLSISTAEGKNALVLVLKAAITGINAELKPTLGANAIQTAVDSGINVSPDATAERIVSLSTAFFGAYQEANPDLDFDTALNQFIDVISGGIDQGFAEARDILDGLQVLNGDIASNIDTTYQLVQDKLATFVENLRGNQGELTEQSPGEQLGIE